MQSTNASSAAAVHGERGAGVKKGGETMGMTTDGGRPRPLATESAIIVENETGDVDQEAAIATIDEGELKPSTLFCVIKLYIDVYIQL